MEIMELMGEFGVKSLLIKDVTFRRAIQRKIEWLFSLLLK